MIIVKFIPGLTDTKAETVRFPRATSWSVDDSGALPVLHLFRPITSSCANCSNCGDTEEIIASVPWRAVQMVYEHDALDASV